MVKTKSKPQRNDQGHFVKDIPLSKINSVIVPIPTLDEQKAGIIYLYGITPKEHGLWSVIIYKIKDNKIFEKVETVETTKQLQIQHVAGAIGIPGYERNQ